MSYRCSEMPCQITQVAHGTIAYQQAVALRQEVLRTPLGLHFTPEQLAAEAGSCHLTCFCGQEMAGCLVLLPLAGGRVQMRQVAVRDCWRGQGIGQQLVAAAEEWARGQGFHVLMLHARESAVGFYEKLDYQKQGARFVEIGLTHWEMTKSLTLTRAGQT